MNSGFVILLEVRFFQQVSVYYRFLESSSLLAKRVYDLCVDEHFLLPNRLDLRVILRPDVHTKLSNYLNNSRSITAYSLRN